MKKEIIKSFDLASYKNGAKVKTRDGHEVRIICTDKKCPYFPIIALVKLADGSESTQFYTSNGRKQPIKCAISNDDLVIVEEVEEPEFWSDKENEIIEGHYISLDSTTSPFCTNINANNYGLFAKEKQAKSASALAMARIRAYTTIEQSHKLAKILPLESADMLFQLGEDKYADSIRVPLTKKHWEQMMPEVNSCWSLAALLNVIPQEIFDGEYIINITEGCDDRWVLTYDHYENRNHSYFGLATGADNLVDACYEMILKLHELNLL